MSDDEGTHERRGRGRSAADRATGAAVLDLASRLGVAAEGIRVLRVEEVTWRDASLGCPQPGRVYAQMLTDGLRIELEAAGHVYRYHSGGGRDPFLCDRLPPPTRFARRTVNSDEP